MRSLDLREVLSSLVNFKRILITGPQRSGTTIASRIISYELGLKWITEESVDVDKLDLFFKLHFSEDNYVLQAPGLSFICHLLPVDAVVFLWRPDKEIANSVARIGWMKHDKYESEKYFRRNRAKRSWSLKKNIYECYQISKIKNAYTLDYKSLEGHSLYVSADQRMHFHCRQIEPRRES